MDQTRENYEQKRVKNRHIVQGVETLNKTSRMELLAGRSNRLAFKDIRNSYLSMSKAIVVCSIIS